MAGPYIAKASDLTAKTRCFGDGECVALVRALTVAPSHQLWCEGTKLADAIRAPNGIAGGTAIATFVNGVYLSLQHGNHAALFVSAAPDFSSVVVFDQWKGQLPHLRTLYFARPATDSASNRAEAFAVIV